MISCALFLPYLYAFYFVFFAYSQNVLLLSYYELFLPLLILGSLLTFVYLTLYLLRRISTKVHLSLVLQIIAFFSFGQIANSFQNTTLSIGPLVLGPYKLAAIIVLFFLVSTHCFLVKTKLPLHNIVKFFLLANCFLLASPLYTTIHYSIKNSNHKTSAHSETTSPSTNLSQPDIYYIILDAYGRQDRMQSLYGFDNSDFIDSLEQIGFYVASKSISNYPHTVLSVSSTLNMSYVQDFSNSDGLSIDQIDWNYLHSKIEHSDVFRIFKDMGYHLISFRSGFFGTEVPSADTYLGLSWSLFDNYFINLLINQTPIPFLLNIFNLSSVEQLHGKKIIYMLDHLIQSSPTQTSPNFVFAHFVCPHGPFAFDRNGPLEKPHPAHMSTEEYQKAYTEQILFLNRELLPKLKTLIQNSNPKPIIVLESDHGFDSYFENEDSWNTGIQEKAHNFSAIYYPDHNYDQLYPSMSNIHTFRFILNKYFNYSLPKLPDHHFYTHGTPPYHFKDVTAEVS